MMLTLEVGNSYIKIGPSWILMTILLAGLKLYWVIAWSWLWVLSPLWFLPLVMLMLVLLVTIIARATKAFSALERGYNESKK